MHDLVDEMRKHITLYKNKYGAVISRSLYEVQHIVTMTHQFFLYSTKITNLPQRDLQTVQHATPSVLRPLTWIGKRGRTYMHYVSRDKKTPSFSTMAHHNLFLILYLDPH